MKEKINIHSSPQAFNPPQACGGLRGRGSRYLWFRGEFSGKNNVEIAKFLGISKVTVGKYLNNKLIYDNKYIFKGILK